MPNDPIRDLKIKCREVAVLLEQVSPSAAITAKESDRLDLAGKKMREIEAALAQLDQPHPDSVRLGWLINSSNHAENAFLSDEFWDSLPGDSDDLLAEGRAAIDAAMPEPCSECRSNGSCASCGGKG